MVLPKLGHGPPGSALVESPQRKQGSSHHHRPKTPSHCGGGGRGWVRRDHTAIGCWGSGRSSLQGLQGGGDKWLRLSGKTAGGERGVTRWWGRRQRRPNRERTLGQLWEGRLEEVELRIKENRGEVGKLASLGLISGYKERHHFRHFCVEAHFPQCGYLKT